MTTEGGFCWRFNAAACNVSSYLISGAQASKIVFGDAICGYSAKGKGKMGFCFNFNPAAPDVFKKHFGPLLLF